MLPTYLTSALCQQQVYSLEGSGRTGHVYPSPAQRMEKEEGKGETSLKKRDTMGQHAAMPDVNLFAELGISSKTGIVVVQVESWLIRRNFESKINNLCAFIAAQEENVDNVCCVMNVERKDLESVEMMK